MSEFGFGRIRLETLNPITSIGNSAMLELCITQLTVDSTPTEVTARCRNRDTGFLETKSKGLSELIHNITITWEAQDWAQTAFAHDELPQDSATDNIPIKFATVPATPFTITDADITAANEADVRVYVTKKGTWGQAFSMTNVAIAPASTEEVQVDGTAGELIFDSSLAGAEIAYIVPIPYTAIATIGEEASFESYGDIRLWYTAYGDDDIPEGLTYYFPSMTRNAGPPTIDRANSPITYQTVYEAVSLTGREFPYIVQNTEYGTAA